MIPPTAAARRPGGATAPTARPRLAGLARAAARKLSDRVHASADDQARALGWQVTETAGPLGLTGRRYRDPRFAARASQQPSTTGTRGTR
jgi:hypothetical protein